MLPSLDRLAGLIERVVELVNEVAGAPERVPERVPEVEAAASPPAPEESWLVLVPSPEGYRLVEQPGSPPQPGDSLELSGVGFRVLRQAPSPFPGDHRRCVVLEMQEPSGADRTFDA